MNCPAPAPAVAGAPYPTPFTVCNCTTTPACPTLPCTPPAGAAAGTAATLCTHHCVVTPMHACALPTQNCTPATVCTQYGCPAPYQPVGNFTPATVCTQHGCPSQMAICRPTPGCPQPNVVITITASSQHCY